MVRTGIAEPSQLSYFHDLESTNSSKLLCLSKPLKPRKQFIEFTYCEFDRQNGEAIIILRVLRLLSCFLPFRKVLENQRQFTSTLLLPYANVLSVTCFNLLVFLSLSFSFCLSFIVPSPFALSIPHDLSPVRECESAHDFERELQCLPLPFPISAVSLFFFSLFSLSFSPLPLVFARRSYLCLVAQDQQTLSSADPGHSPPFLPLLL